MEKKSRIETEIKKVKENNFKQSSEILSEVSWKHKLNSPWGLNPGWGGGAGL